MPVINLCCRGCIKNNVYPLFAEDTEDAVLYTNNANISEIEKFAAGGKLVSKSGGEALLQLVAFHWQANRGVSRLPVFRALRELPAGEMKDLIFVPDGPTLAVITLSDKGARGLRRDESGPEIINMLKDFLDFSCIYSFLIADEADLLKALLADLAYNQRISLILTTGGTGIGERDITPQVTEKLLDIKLPGFILAMMTESLKQTPNAIISRASAGLIGKSLVINLPGSLKAVRCNLKAIMPALKHALDKAGGDNTDCGGN